jgi:hypothetical protein
MFLYPTINTPNVMFASKELNYPYEKREFREKYATLETAKARKTGKIGKAGHAARSVISHQGFKDRYCIREFTIPCDPFEVELNADIYNVTRGRVNIAFFLGEWSKHGNWLICQRNREEPDMDGKTYSKGSGNEHGRILYCRAGIAFPCVANYMAEYPEATQGWKRFQDNILSVYRQPRNLMDILGLRYHENGLPVGDDEIQGKKPKKGLLTPFVTMQVFIDEIASKRDKYTKQVLDADPGTLLTSMNRGADFTVGTQAHEFIKAACLAAKPNVPQAARDLSEELFTLPIDDEWPNIGSLGTRDRTVLPGLDVIVLDSGEPVLFDGVFHVNKAIRCIIRDPATGKLLRASDCGDYTRTRGQKRDDLTNLTSQFDNVDEAIQKFIEQEMNK